MPSPSDVDTLQRRALGLAPEPAARARAAPAARRGVGDPDAIGHRTLLQPAMTASSLLAAIAAPRVRRAASARVSPAGAAAIPRIKEWTK